MSQASQPQPPALGELYTKCVQLVNENRISAKNAFDLPLIEHLVPIIDSFVGGGRKSNPSGRKSTGGARLSTSSVQEEEEHRFHEASCTIEASARIYACRVDCVHTDTYRVLGGLNAADLGDDDGKEGEEGKNPAKRRRICGVNTLEKNEASLIQQKIEADEESDPMFRRMAAAFDAGGAKGLLLNQLQTAEDLSLVFNTDVPIQRAMSRAHTMFGAPEKVCLSSLGVGDPVAACVKLAESKLCPGIDVFRKQLWGDKSAEFTFPKELEELLGKPPVPAVRPQTRSTAMVPHPGPGPAPLLDAEAPDMHMDDGGDAPEHFSAATPNRRDSNLIPLEGEMAAGEGAIVCAESNRAFDELFEKFCAGSSSHQFAYFDECWTRKARDKENKALGVLADGAADAAQPGAVVEGKERPPKRPLFDLSNVEQPKRIETEPVQKHQLSERAAHWQLHKDVPPYMIDRITMPSWQTWSKCDFACLGLRPHLMLKLQQKPQPPGDGPFSFSDLFSTVLVENPEAFPWLGAGRTWHSSERRRSDRDEENRPEWADADLGEDAAAGDDDFDGSRLPSHLEVDPQGLFLQPDDKVVPGGEDNGYMPEVDFDLVDQPELVGNIDIGYSRNSKFVDVKLVKKHLWDCISQDLTASKDGEKDPSGRSASFQSLVNRTVKRMPREDTENLSVAVCFICALHLCNEKGLELKPDPQKPMGDFAVVGPA